MDNKDLIKANENLRAQNEELQNEKEKLTEQLEQERQKRRNLELQSSESEVRYELVVDAVDMAWWAMDYKSGAVEFHEKKAQMLGLPAENFKHYQDFTALVHPDDHEGAMNAMYALLRGESKLYETEYRIRTADGSYKWFYDIDGFVEKDGVKSSRIVGFVMDVGKRKEAEKLLVSKNSELNSLLSEKDKVLSVISHDLKGPLANISEISLMLLGKKDRLDEEEKKEFLDILHSLANGGVLLLENLLTYARNRNTLRSYNPKLMNLSDVLNECLLLLHGAVVLKSIYLDSDVSKEMGVYGEREQLKAIFRNLISNAIKFTPKGGTVSIKGSSSDENTTVRITDSGIGMDEFTKENLFNNNEKIRRPGTEGEQSSGLGLLIVKDVIDRHNGTIRVISTPGEGTTFEVSLPK